MGLTVNSMHYLRGCGWAMKGVPKFPPCHPRKDQSSISMISKDCRCEDETIAASLDGQGTQ